MYTIPLQMLHGKVSQQQGMFQKPAKTEFEFNI